jgi:hypothetical protein
VGRFIFPDKKMVLKLFSDCQCQRAQKYFSDIFLMNSKPKLERSLEIENKGFAG